MYRQVGLRAVLLGASASGVTGSAGGQGRLPGPLRLLLLVAAGGLTVYLTASITLLVLAVAFRLCGDRVRQPDPAASSRTMERGAFL